MSKRLQSTADTDLIKSLSLPPGMVTPYRLERWRQRGFIPDTVQKGLGQGKGSVSAYPDGTADTVAALVQLLRERRRLDELTLFRLFLDGHEVGEQALRNALHLLLRKVTSDWKEEARACLREKKLKEPGNLSWQRVAEIQAEKFVVGHSGDLVVKLLLSNFRAGEVPEEKDFAKNEAADRVQAAIMHLWYAMLTGRLLPRAADVMRDINTSLGLETFIQSAVRALGQYQGEITVKGPYRTLLSFSMPSLHKTIDRMSMDDLAWARDLSQSIKAVFGGFLPLLFSVAATDASPSEHRESRGAALFADLVLPLAVVSYIDSKSDFRQLEPEEAANRMLFVLASAAVNLPFALVAGDAGE